MVLFVLLFVSHCSTVKPRRPEFAIVKQIEIIDKQTSAHVGIFIPKIQDKSVTYQVIKDDTDPNNPPTIILSLKNVDVANTPVPATNDIRTNAIHKITTRYEDVAESTRGFIHIALTNDYPYQVMEKPFGYEIKILKDKPPLEKFLKKTEEKTEKAEKPATPEQPEATPTEEPLVESETTPTKEETPQETPSFESSGPIEIKGALFQGNSLIIEATNSIQEATLSLSSPREYILKLPNSSINSATLNYLKSIKGKFNDAIQSIQTLSINNNEISIAIRVKKDVYPVLKHTTGKTLILFKELHAPLDDFGSYLDIKEEISQKKITLNLKDIKIYDALKLLASYTDLNFVLDKNIEGRTNLKLKDVSWDAAFTMLLQSERLGFVREKGNIIRVASLLSLIKEKELAYRAHAAQAALQEKEAAVFPLSYIEVSQFKGKVEGFLSEQGNLIIDESSNTLMVYDHPSRIQKIYELLSNADFKRAHVILKAEIVEASSEFHKEIQEHLDKAIEVMENSQFQGNVKNYYNLEEFLKRAEADHKISRVSFPELSALDRKNTSVSATVKTENKNTVFKLSVLPRIIENDDILLEVKFEKEHPLSDKSEVFINAQTHLLTKNNNTSVVGGFTTSGKEFFILITPTIKNI
ncbi:MAG: secretin and TonB N-terminal domain-containing protein [Deltaproteobacteria bacterium]|nr:secretin and TonB N-terminal domain-containing protein [Deltaproteobacteria bacterium]